MTNSEVTRHPMYAILAATMGERAAAQTLRDLVEKERLSKQATVEASSDARKIIIPATMNKMEASQELERQWNDEETIIDVDRQFNTWNWKDVLVAVKKAADQYFGWIQGKTIVSMFGTSRPSEIEVVVDIKNGKKVTETCFYGAMEISAWENAQVNVDPRTISTSVKKRYANQVKEFYDLVQNILDTQSIYRGKSITVTQLRDPWGNVSLDFEIFELKTSDKIFLNEDAQRINENFILDDLTEEGKRCYLFSGGYGNGKTETAMKIGKVGLEKNMSFFYCKDAKAFHVLLKQAVNYQPCIIFLEDLDEIGSGEQRDAEMNLILNTLDGVQTKGNNLTVIFTTNHESRINKALRRPGRIDLVLKFDNPNKDTIQKIYQSYFGELEAEYGTSLDYNQIINYTPDVPGAVIAEIAKRAVRLCTKHKACTEELVKTAIDSMAHHLLLMNEPVETVQNGKMAIILEGANVNLTSVENAIETIEADFN